MSLYRARNAFLKLNLMNNFNPMAALLWKKRRMSMTYHWCLTSIEVQLTSIGKTSEVIPSYIVKSVDIQQLNLKKSTCHLTGLICRQTCISKLSAHTFQRRVPINPKLVSWGQFGLQTYLTALKDLIPKFGISLTYSQQQLPKFCGVCTYPAYSFEGS